MTRTFTRDEVQAVVQGIAAEGTWLESFEEGAREVLRRLDALPNPPAAPESSAREDPRAATLEDFRNGVGQRPRAATPTPEVPPYAKQDGTRRAALTRLHEGLAPLPTGALASNEPVPEVPALKSIPGLPMMPLALQQAIQARKAEVPEPTAPEVVWEGATINGRRLRVMGDGSVRADNNDGTGWREPAAWQLSVEEDALARALAEAKRELRCDHWQPKEYCAQSFNDAVDAAKARGAESMRERAMALIMVEQARQEDGPLSDDNGHAFNLLLRLADAVGALPLEES